MRAPGLLATLAVALVLSGALGAPFLEDEVSFSTVQREHFDALAVSAQKAQPSSQPLVVRVHVVGDAADADLSAPFTWLREHANVVVERDARGVPLYLTYNDLSATSGRQTLGATVPAGMAVEMREATVGDCVVAHEILHFIGLKHVPDRSNIMYQHCSPGFLDRAHLSATQLSQIAAVEEITATTPQGVVAWATR